MFFTLFYRRLGCSVLDDDLRCLFTHLGISLCLWRRVAFIWLLHVAFSDIPHSACVFSPARSRLCSVDLVVVNRHIFDDCCVNALLATAPEPMAQYVQCVRDRPQAHGSRSPQPQPCWAVRWCYAKCRASLQATCQALCLVGYYASSACR